MGESKVIKGEVISCRGSTRKKKLWGGIKGEKSGEIYVSEGAKNPEIY